MYKLCSTKCWFIFFNLLFLRSALSTVVASCGLLIFYMQQASGVALIAIGTLQCTTFSQMDTFTGSGLSKIAAVLIVVGVTIVLVSVFGHVGAIINSSSMVAGYICILLVIIILEILTGAAFYILRSRAALIQLNSGINSKARGMIYEYKPENRDAIDTIQEKFSCCGADLSTDWSRSVGWENHDVVPDSCCVVKREGCGQKKENIHTKGCIVAIKRFLFYNLVWVGAVCIALGVTEVFGVLIGLCLLYCQ